MALLAGDRALEPPQPLAVGDDADVLALGFEDRALLDVQLEKRWNFRPPTGSLPLKPMRSSSSPKWRPFASVRP